MKTEHESAIVREYVAYGRSAACPVIDMHGHLGPLGSAYLPAAGPERMRAVLARAGVQRIVCCPHEALFATPERGNRLMQETIDADPELFLGYRAVNPNMPVKAERLAADVETSRGFVGFKFLPDYHARALNGSGYESALEYADAKRLLVLVHTWGGSPFNSPQHVETVADRYRHAVFLMGHSGYGDWEQSVRLGREMPNVYLELTAVYVAHDFAMLPAGSGTPATLASCLQVNGVIEYMVEHAGSEKIVFGTDLPWYSPHFAAGAVLFADIADEARHDILHRNAERLLQNPGGEQRGKQP